MTLHTSAPTATAPIQQHAAQVNTKTMNRTPMAQTLDDFVSDWAAGGPMFRERVELAQRRERERARHENRPPRPIRLGRSPKTIGNAIVVLSALFKDAVAWERLAASPAVALTRPRDDRPTDERMRPLDADGLRALVAAADGPLARALLLTAAMTGARRGELLALRWSDVDYANGRIWIRRSIGIGGEVKKPKTAKSVRAVALPKTLRDGLEEWWKRSSHRGQDDYVFPSSTGTNGAEAFRSVATAEGGILTIKRSSGSRRNCVTLHRKLLTGGLLVRVQPGELLLARARSAISLPPRARSPLRLRRTPTTSR
jgi:integrase